MKRLLITLTAVATLVAGAQLNGGGNTVEGSGTTPTPAESELASLGPTSLITAFYGVFGAVPCENGATDANPSRCGNTLAVDGGGTPFDFTGASVTSCVGVGTFVVDASPGNGRMCSLNPSNQLQFQVDVTNSAIRLNTPCAGTTFASVTLTNGVGDTLTIMVSASQGNSNPNNNCTTGVVI